MAVEQSDNSVYFFVFYHFSEWMSKNSNFCCIWKVVSLGQTVFVFKIINFYFQKRCQRNSKLRVINIDLIDLIDSRREVSWSVIRRDSDERDANHLIIDASNSRMDIYREVRKVKLFKLGLGKSWMKSTLNKETIAAMLHPSYNCVALSRWF